jgi:hypothetical protein
MVVTRGLSLVWELYMKYVLLAVILGGCATNSAKPTNIGECQAEMLRIQIQAIELVQQCQHLMPLPQGM